MGASNAIAAFRAYAGTVPPLSMQLLLFMALVSKDDDERPWFGQGHAALAEHAMGRPEPLTDSDHRAVRRAITPLLERKAITVDRPASGRRDGPMTVRYRLNLRFDVGRKASGDADTTDCSPIAPATRSSGALRRTEFVRNVGRKTDQRRTKSVPAQDGIRPPEEEEENEERGEDEKGGFPTQVQTARAKTCPTHDVYLDPDGSCFACGGSPRRRAS